MTSTPRFGGVGALVRRLRLSVLGRKKESLAGSFVERSRGLYVNSRFWLNTTGAVAIASVSLLEGWRAGFVPAGMVAAMAVHSLVFRNGTRPTRDLVMDITVLGISLVLIGIPEVVAVMAVVLTFLTALLLDRRTSVLVSIYLLAWVAVAYAVDALRVEQTLPASNPVPWIGAGTVIAVVLVLVVSHRVVGLIGELETVRAQFMGGMVHDLRNPLSAVIGAAAVLRESDLDEDERTEMIDMILGQAGEANRMVTDLLDSVRLDGSTLDLALQIVDMGQVVAETLMVMTVAHEGSSVDFLLPDRPIMAWADPMRVKQVIQNLVSNAVRYGGTRIRVMIENRKDAVAVQVVDNGPGIVQSEQESIFAPFTRATQGRKQAASVGLGLSVARRLARLMGGDLVYRHVGGDSVFELTVPLPTQPLAFEIAERAGAVATDPAEVWPGAEDVLLTDPPIEPRYLAAQ